MKIFLGWDKQEVDLQEGDLIEASEHEYDEYDSTMVYTVWRKEEKIYETPH